jgi:hypothetical protein
MLFLSEERFIIVTFNDVVSTTEVLFGGGTYAPVRSLLQVP